MIQQQPFSGNEPRWLNPDNAAAYIGVRVERLRPLVKAGKLPPPSYHLGPNQPRFDRLALDRVFGGEGRRDAEDTSAAFQRAASQIIEEGRRKRARSKTQAGRRDGAGIPLWPASPRREG
jgi:hypothetical protein